MCGFQQLLIVRVKRRRQLNSYKLLFLKLPILIVQKSPFLHLLRFRFSSIRHHFSTPWQSVKLFTYLCYRLRSCSTAASDYICPLFRNIKHFPGEISRSSSKMHLISRKIRISGIRKCDEELTAKAVQTIHELCHVSRTHTAVKPYRVHRKLRGIRYEPFSTEPCGAIAILVHAETYTYKNILRTIPYIPDCRKKLLIVGKGLKVNSIDSCLKHIRGKARIFALIFTL